MMLPTKEFNFMNEKTIYAWLPKTAGAPEPSSLALALFGLLGLGGRRLVGGRRSPTAS